MISATKEIDLDQLIFCLGRASWKSGFNTVLFQCILEDCYCEQKQNIFSRISSKFLAGKQKDGNQRYVRTKSNMMVTKKATFGRKSEGNFHSFCTPV